MSDSACGEVLSRVEPSRNTVPARSCPASATVTFVNQPTDLMNTDY